MFGKTCKICGKDFDALRTNCKYCSEECRKVAQYKKSAERFQARHNDFAYRLYHAQKSTEYYYQHREEILAKCRQRRQSNANT